MVQPFEGLSTIIFRLNNNRYIELLNFLFCNNLFQNDIILIFTLISKGNLPSSPYTMKLGVVVRTSFAKL
jgi:hypothetical protein